MPSRVFTRQQVLRALSDEAARQEQDAVPDFIYYFLRDVFYAVDADGDGYVTADAACRAVPSLSPVKANSPNPSPTSATPSGGAHRNSKASEVTSTTHASLMTPGFQPTWGCPYLFLSSHDASITTASMRRPLDLCAFMQTFWPIVSDKMARLKGDCWSQQSSGSSSPDHDRLSCEGNADSDGGTRDCSNSTNNRGGSRYRRSPSRRTAFSPSPFRGVSLPPARTAPPTAAAGPRESSEVAASRPVVAPASTSPSPGILQSSGSQSDFCDDQHAERHHHISWEQQRLYRETLQHLWPAAHNTPLEDHSDSGRHASPISLSPSPRPASLVAPPRRLYSDHEVEQLQVAFAFLDREDIGFVSAGAVAEALAALLNCAKGCDAKNVECPGGESGNTRGGTPVDTMRGDVRAAAEAMVRLALSSTAQASATAAAAAATAAVTASSGLTTSASTVTCISLDQLDTATPLALRNLTSNPCLTLPRFIRSFQCDSGAFPAELIAWCVRCSARARQRSMSSLSFTPPLLSSPPHRTHALATSLQWMSPLECAVLQQTLERYTLQISACTADNQGEGARRDAMAGAACTDADAKQTAGASRKPLTTGKLSSRATVNVDVAREAGRHHGSRSCVRQPSVPVNKRAKHNAYLPSLPKGGSHSAFAQWCACLKASLSTTTSNDSVAGAGGDNEMEETDAPLHPAVLPLHVLESALLHDIRGALFANAFDFSDAAGTAAEAILWSQVQAVCRLALRVALVDMATSRFATSGENGEKGESVMRPGSSGVPAGAASAALVDVSRLSDVISADPRYLGLEVLVPLPTRLEAVVVAAQQLPRRCVEQAVRAISEHVRLAQQAQEAAVGVETDKNSLSCAALQLTHLLALRRQLMRVHPPLARLVTGATRFVGGALTLHDCLAVLSAQVLVAPPPLRTASCNSRVGLPQRRDATPTTTTVANTSSNKDGRRERGEGAHLRKSLTHAERCAALARDGQLVMASRGWLRYGCRRLLRQERQDIVAALRHNEEASLYEAVRAISPSTTDAKPSEAVAGGAEGGDGDATTQLRYEEMYVLFFHRVCASCWTCRVDLCVAAHVALALLASACAVLTNQDTEEGKYGQALAGESLFWGDVELHLEAWLGAQWAVQSPTDSYSSPNGVRNNKKSNIEQDATADAWAMAAICSTAAELGQKASQSLSVRLCQLRSDIDKSSRAVTVKEEDLCRALTSVIERESLWAPLRATSALTRDACARLANTIVGCCPSFTPVPPRRSTPSRTADAAGAATAVDITHLLRRWLEAFPLPLPVKHLSLVCPIDEVESIYYTLKRLAASEASQRRRSESPHSRATSLLQNDPFAGDGLLTDAADTTRVVVTGITSVCLAELLENDAVLAALYAVSPPAALGEWSGSLCYLETVLRPVVLSATGVRVSLRKLNDEEVTASPPTPWADYRLRQRALVAMAVPPAVQHAVAQLFSCVDADGVGAVSEDQLRGYRPHVPAAVRYGWHRFVTMLCCSSIDASPISVTGGFAAGVLRSHCWRRNGEGEATMLSEASSVATQRTDDVATTYSCGDLLARVGELRACVQAQLLVELKARGKESFEQVKPRENLLHTTLPAAEEVTTLKGPAAGTAQWWAGFLEIFCQNYSAVM